MFSQAALTIDPANIIMIKKVDGKISSRKLGVEVFIIVHNCTSLVYCKGSLSSLSTSDYETFYFYGTFVGGRAAIWALYSTRRNSLVISVGLLYPIANFD